MLVTVVLYMLLPVVAAAIRPLRPRSTSVIQHVAAGVVFTAAIELLPELLTHSPVPTLIGCALGSALMFTLRWASAAVARTGRGGAAA